MRCWDDNGQLRVPPYVPQVDERKPILWTHDEKPLVRAVGFRVRS